MADGSANSRTVQTFWISIGGFFSYGFGIISSMILSRYFNKPDYGTYKQVLYVYNTLLMVFTLGLPSSFSYFLPRIDKTQAKDLIKKITNIFFILGSIFSILLFSFSSQIAVILKNPDLGLAIRIFSPVPFLMLPTMGLEGILASFNRGKYVALYTVSTRLFMLLCVALPVVIFNGGYISAIIGFLVSSFISFLLALYLKYLPTREYHSEKCTISSKEIFKYSLPLLYASVWGIIINSSDQFFISRYFGKDVFAEFSNGFIELPFVGMITSACGTVLFPLFSKIDGAKLDPCSTIFPVWKSVFEKTAKLIYPLLAFFWFFAIEIMAVLYGAKYSTSGNYFRLKLIVNCFTLIQFSPVILAIGKTRIYANIHMFSALLLVPFEFIFAEFTSNVYAICVVSVVCQIGRIFAMLAVISRYFNVRIVDLFPLRLICKIFIPSIIFLFFLHKIQFQFSLLLNLLLYFCCYMIFYYILSKIEHIRYTDIFRPLLCYVGVYKENN